MRLAMAHKHAGRSTPGLGFVLALSAFAVAQAAAPQGYIARGTATVQTARGAESGPITVEVWDAAHCRVTLDVSRPGVERRWAAVLDGRHAQVSGPRGLVKALTGPDPIHGCALLPLGGQPASLSWQVPAGKVHVSYAGYTSSGGIGYPAAVTETVAGGVRLSVKFAEIAAKPDFTEADFALPPLHAPATHGYGGGL